MATDLREHYEAINLYFQSQFSQPNIGLYATMLLSIVYYDTHRPRIFPKTGF